MGMLADVQGQEHSYAAALEENAGCVSSSSTTLGHSVAGHGHLFRQRPGWEGRGVSRWVWGRADPDAGRR